MSNNHKFLNRFKTNNSVLKVIFWLMILTLPFIVLQVYCSHFYRKEEESLSDYANGFTEALTQGFLIF